MRLALILTCALTAGAASAHDLPKLKTPSDTVTVQQPMWPEFGRAAGEGNVRLVYHSAGVAMRMDVNEFHAYEKAYTRRLNQLMLRMSYEAADPIARHGAWHDIAGQGATPALTTGVSLTRGQ